MSFRRQASRFGPYVLYIAVLVTIIYVINIAIENNLLKGLLTGGVGVTGVFIALSLYLLANPGTIQKWQSIFFGALRRYNTRADRKYVQKNAESVFNSASEDTIGYDVDYGARIKWENNADRDSLLENDEIIICLDDGDHQSENIARAALEYSRRGIAPDARRHLSSELNKGLNFSVSQNILKSEDQEDAVRVLYEDVILPTLEEQGNDVENSPVKEAFDKVECTRKGGLLGPVLLNEIEKLTEEGVFNAKIRKEADEFVDFLEEVATTDDDIKLHFEGDYINVKLGLMARAPRELGPYIKMMNINIEEADTAYLLAVGNYIRYAKEVFDRTKNSSGVLQTKEVTYELDEDSYFGGQKSRYCAIYECEG